MPAKQPHIVQLKQSAILVCCNYFTKHRTVRVTLSCHSCWENLQTLALYKLLLLLYCCVSHTHTKSMSTAVPLLIPSISCGVTSSPMLSCPAAVGMMMPMHDKNSRLLVAWLATALNVCVLNRMPPNRKQQPADRQKWQQGTQSHRRIQPSVTR